MAQPILSFNMRFKIVSSIPSITGGCYCGSVRYEIQGEILNQGVCHCVDCQKLTGGTSWPFLFILSESLKYQGNVNSFERTAFSGKKVTLEFCPKCGTTLFGRPEFWEGCSTVSASTLDNPKHFYPLKHVWTEEAPKWQAFKEGIPLCKQNP